MAANRDYYSILQVNPRAKPEVIDAAYDRLSKLYDPQTSRKAKAAERYREVEEAYEVLGDPARRAEYDRLRAKGYRPGQSMPESGTRARGVRGVVQRVWGLLDNPYVFAGLAALGVVVILGAIVLVSLVGDNEGESAVQQPSPTAATGTPGATAPANPPPVTGEEVTTPSGLRYIDTQVGTGASPVLGDTVRVHYTGWRTSDGVKFDSSVDRGEPSEFALGQVIEGWNEGLASMKEGGTRRLLIPAALAYGEAGRGENIPPNTDLTFDVTLIAVIPAASATPAGASPSP